MFGFLWIAGTAYAQDSGWQSAHATFYGGSDASGTMGKFTLRQNSSLMDSRVGVDISSNIIALQFQIYINNFNNICYLSKPIVKLI